jgi:hypothetical protein
MLKDVNIIPYSKKNTPEGDFLRGWNMQGKTVLNKNDEMNC